MHRCRGCLVTVSKRPVMHLQAQGHQRSPANRRGRREAGAESPSWPQKESARLQPDLERGLPSCRPWARECLLWKAPRGPSKRTPHPPNLPTLTGSLTQAGDEGQRAVTAWHPLAVLLELISKPLLALLGILHLDGTQGQRSWPPAAGEASHLGSASQAEGHFRQMSNCPFLFRWDEKLSSCLWKNGM